MNKEIMAQQMLVMLELQNKMNSTVNPNWINAGNDWTLAILVEAVEAIGHHGWKWWKKETPDMVQLRMELVDIWHFLLSDLIVKYCEVYTYQSMSNLFTDDFLDSELSEKDINDEFTLIQYLKEIIGLAANSQVSIDLFAQTMKKAGLSWNELYSTYIAKNCLNIFRQNNGYKSGEYIKDWSSCELVNPIEMIEDRPLEDNDHLHDLIQSMDMTVPDVFNALTNGLEARYNQIKENAQV